MDIMLITPRMMLTTGSSKVCPGATTLGSYLSHRGFSVSVLDNNSIYKRYSSTQLRRQIQRGNPRLVGISVNLLNARGGLELLGEIKRNLPETIVVGGGLLSHVAAEQMLSDGYDIVFKGEAELGLTRLVETVLERGITSTHGLFAGANVQRLQRIPGMLYHHEGRLVDTGDAEILDDLDEIPFLNSDILNMEDFVRTRFDYTGVIGSYTFQRGCPNNCTYCKADHMVGKVRHNSAEYMYEQVEADVKKHNIEQIYISDSNFPLHRGRMHRFCDLMISSGLSRRVRIWCQTSVNVPLPLEDARLLKSAGVVTISVGIERLSERIRTSINKKGSADEATALVRRIKQAGIKTSVNMLVNLPADTVENLREERRLLEQLLPDIDYCCINYLVPIPGTAMYDPSASYHDWYMDPRNDRKVLSYYDMAFNISTVGLEYNLFGHAPSTVTAIRSFKEYFHAASVKKMSQHPLFKSAFHLDISLARLSCRIYGISPRLEQALFGVPKVLRGAANKAMMNTLFYTRSS